MPEVRVDQRSGGVTMCADNRIKIDLGTEAHRLFYATRMVACMNLGCKHNDGHANCVFKEIRVDKTGQCEQFESKQDAVNPDLVQRHTTGGIVAIWQECGCKSRVDLINQTATIKYCSLHGSALELEGALKRMCHVYEMWEEVPQDDFVSAYNQAIAALENSKGWQP